MSLIDIFKKKPEKKQAAKKEITIKKKKAAQETRKEKPKPEPEIKKTPEPVPQKQKNESVAGELGWVLRAPQVSEKAGFLAEKNQYIFRVSSLANKNDIKKAVEGIFGVNVLSARTIKIPKKERRVGKTTGFKKGYKKSIVKIREGQKIEVLPR